MAEAPSTFPELFFRQAARKGDATALRHKEYGIWKRISWRQYGDMVVEVAAGLLAFGLARGDKVAILGDNCPEWLVCHIATMTVGGVTCGVYPTSAPEQIAYVVGHSESKILFVENEEQVDKVLQILPELKVTTVVVWDPKGLWGFSHPRIIFYDDFLEKAREKLRNEPGCVEQALRQVQPDDTAMIIIPPAPQAVPKAP